MLANFKIQTFALSYHSFFVKFCIYHIIPFTRYNIIEQNFLSSLINILDTFVNRHLRNLHIVINHIFKQHSFSPAQRILE